MGLGKTIQSITFLSEIFVRGIHGPFLIIAPLSTITNWEREFRTWTEMNAIVYHGSQISRQMIQQYEMVYRDAQVSPTEAKDPETPNFTTAFLPPVFGSFSPSSWATVCLFVGFLLLRLTLCILCKTVTKHTLKCFLIPMRYTWGLFLGHWKLGLLTNLWSCLFVRSAKTT